jgi:hypothetical protein
MITVQSMTLDKEFSILQNCLEKANFGDKVRIIVKEGEIRLLSTSGNVYWHNIGFNEQDWWEYLKTNQIITANFTNQAGDEGEKLLTSYHQGDTIIAYASSFGAIGWGMITKDSSYQLISTDSSENIKNGQHLHRLKIEWQCVADKIEDAITAGDILNKFNIHHPIPTSVRISDNEKAELLIQELENKFN